MILQNTFDWIDFIAKIIGSLIATFFTILVWIIIEKLKERGEKKKLEKNINTLYKILLNKKLDAHTSTEVTNLLVYEIGIENVNKILKMRTIQFGGGYKFESNLYILRTHLGRFPNTMIISEVPSGPRYNFTEPNTNEPIYERFIEDFKKNCKEKNIKLEF